MNLILLILRLLFGPLAPRWDEAVPLVIRRDGRVHQRLEQTAEEPSDRRPTVNPWSCVWRSLVRAVGWCGRKLGVAFGLVQTPGGG
jgi:hypothetical protein